MICEGFLFVLSTAVPSCFLRLPLCFPYLCTDIPGTCRRCYHYNNHRSHSFSTGCLENACGCCGGTEQVLEVMAAIDELNFVEMAMLIDVFKVKTVPV